MPLRMPVSLVLAALAWALFIPRTDRLHAQGSSATLAGVVVDTAFRPLPDVMVYLDSAELVDWTDAEGHFELTGVPGGAHHIHFRKSDWAARSFGFTLGDGSGGVIDIGAIPLAPGVRPTATVRGTVVDARSSEPLSAVEILVNGTPIGQADERGRFRVDRAGVSWGSNLLSARRIGYASVTDVIWVDAADAEFQFTIRLQPLSVLLPEVVVLGDRTIYEFGRMRGFWQRRRAGWGHFLTRDEIEKRAAAQTSDLLRQVPGVLVSSNGFRTDILSFRQAGRCRLAVFVDGIHLVGDLDINAYTVPDWIEGVEIYTGAATIPPEFNRTGQECGAIVIWTR